MKLYINTTKMTFEEDNVDHDIIRNITDREILCCDYVIELSDDDKFIKDTLKIIYKKNDKGNDTEEIENKVFMIREQKTWNNFPLYELKDKKIIPFHYKNYQYFKNTDRRMVLTGKISGLYSSSSEAKILRKTLKKILDHLGITDEDFEKYNNKVETLISKNPKI